MLSHETIMSIIKRCAATQMLDETEFCKRFSFGHLACGNSDFDLLSAFWDAPDRLFMRTFYDVASVYQQFDETEGYVYDDLCACIDFYEDLKRSAGRTIVA